MNNMILSVGIDIGTTTTQIIFSEITVQNVVNSFFVPNVKITEKNVIYRSRIYFTPLISKEIINLEELKKIIIYEYKKAGIDKKDISTGAIIITGETARKENAEQVLNTLSDFAGDFVVATVGANLEAILAGYGSGAAEISRKKISDQIINFDIGGGTTNAVILSNGEVIDSFALDIGGRLIKFNKNGNIIYISDKIMDIIQYLNLNLKIGYKPDIGTLKILTDEFANIIFKICFNHVLSDQEKKLYICSGNLKFESGFLVFSGGVSEFIYKDYTIINMSNILKFNDLGILLGYSIKEKFQPYEYKILKPKEKIRATVIGAGIHSIKISGSTVMYEKNILPLKNIPIVKLFNKNNENLEYIYKNICKRCTLYSNMNIAISFNGPRSPTYNQVKNMAISIVKALGNRDGPIIVIVKNDFAKALGQAIKNIVKDSKAVISIDRIDVNNGDYVDIGNPISEVIPVVVKTLVYEN